MTRREARLGGPHRLRRGGGWWECDLHNKIERVSIKEGGMLEMLGRFWREGGS